MNNITSPISSEDWERTLEDPSYTFAEVEAYMARSYQQGFDDKEELIQQKYNRIFKDNGLVTSRIVASVIDKLEANNIVPIMTYMKVESIFSFGVVITLNLEDYISEKLLDLYKWSGEMERTLRTPTFSIEISFMYDQGDVDVECLSSDGYHYKYKPLSGQSA